MDERILLVLLWPIGDTLFTTPAIRALREARPSARIDALVYRSNAPILEHNPDVDDLLVHPVARPIREWRRLPGLVRELRRRRYGLAIEFSGPSRHLTSLIGGIPRRVQTPFPSLWWLLPSRDPAWGRTHCVDHALATVAQAGVPRPAAPRLRYDPTAPEIAAARRLRDRLAPEPGRPLVLVHPGGDGLQGKKRWAPERFAWVIRQIQDAGARPVMIGGPADVPVARRVLAHVPGVTSLAGALSLRESAALIAQASLLVGNDSAPLHLAAALGTPLVGIYGPSSRSNFTPWAAPGRSVVLAGSPPCAPCFHFAGTQPLWKPQGCNHQVCLEDVSPQAVAQAALRLLEAVPAAAPSPAMPSGWNRTPGDPRESPGAQTSAPPGIPVREAPHPTSRQHGRPR